MEPPVEPSCGAFRVSCAGLSELVRAMSFLYNATLDNGKTVPRWERIGRATLTPGHPRAYEELLDDGETSPMREG